MEKKKLELKKQTIVDLSDSEALQVKGGTTPGTGAAIPTTFICAVSAGLVILTIKVIYDYATNNITNTCDCDQINATALYANIGPGGEAVCVLNEIVVKNY